MFTPFFRVNGYDGKVPTLDHQEDHIWGLIILYFLLKVFKVKQKAFKRKGKLNNQLKRECYTTERTTINGTDNFDMGLKTKQSVEF